MRQKLFTKEIDNKLFAQYKYGSDLSKQMVVAKIFNPFNRGQWYIINSDPNDPDYLWAIVDLFEIEAGSVSREDLQTIKVPPFGLNLERDLYFQPINAQELYDRLRQGERFEDGGKIKVGDVVEVKEPNYGRDDSYYVVNSKAGYDENGFLISSTRARLGDVFEEEQLRKLYEHGGSVDVIQNDKDESYLTSVNAKPTDAAIKLAAGGETANNFVVTYEINGKQYESIYLLYPSDRVENLLPPNAKIISIQKKYAHGGMSESIEVGDLVRVKKYGFIMRVDKIEGNMYFLENDRRGSMNGNNGSYLISDIEKYEKYADGGEVSELHSKVLDYLSKHRITISAFGKNGNNIKIDDRNFGIEDQIAIEKMNPKILVSGSSNSNTWYIFMPEKYADGGVMAKGSRTKSYTYIPKSDIKGIDAVIGGKEQKISGKDVLDGAHVKKSVPKSNKGKLSERAQGILDSSLESFERQSEKQKLASIKMVENNLESNKKGIDTIGMGLDEDKVAAGEEFIKIVKSKKYEDKPEIELGTFKDARYAKGKVLYMPPSTGADNWKNRQMRLAEAKGISGKYTNREHGYIMSKSQAEKLKKYILEGYDAGVMTGELVKPQDLYAKGGVTFKDKVKSISNSLNGKKVPSKLKKDYGATYDKKESVLAATRIAGAMKAKMETKKKR